MPQNAPFTRRRKMWCVIVAAISPLFDKIAITFTKIQARNIVISQQRQEMSKLVVDIVAGMDIRPAIDEMLEVIDPFIIIMQSNYFILKDFFVMHIQDQRSWVCDLYNDLSHIDKLRTLKQSSSLAFLLLLMYGRYKPSEIWTTTSESWKPLLLCPRILSISATPHSSKMCWIHIAFIYQNIGLNNISITWRMNIDICVHYTIASHMSRRHSISMKNT